MKILQLTVHFSPNIGGVETHLDDLVSGLIEKNNKVFVLTYNPLTANTKAKLWEKADNLMILRLPWITGFFYKLVRNPLFEFLYLMPGLFIAMPFVIFNFRPQVIHTHGLVAGCVGVFWGKLFRIKTILTTHSVYHFPNSGLYPSFVRWMFNMSDHVLTLSKESKKELLRLGIDGNKVTVFTYWIDLKKFKPIVKAKKIVGWKKFTVLFVGRLVEEKGILVLLKSLKKWNENVQLVIAGTGPLETKIRDEESRTKNFIYLGKVNNNDLPKYYSAADLVIVPSIHDEGFGRVILESLACGTPVIASNRGAIPEAMDNSVGELITIDSETIFRTVNKYYINPIKVDRLSRNSRKYSVKRFSSSNINRIIKVYESN